MCMCVCSSQTEVNTAMQGNASLQGYRQTESVESEIVELVVVCTTKLFAHKLCGNEEKIANYSLSTVYTIF